MSHIKYDYRTTAHVVDALGGLKALEEVEHQVEALTLPVCPFCGGEAVVALGSMCAIPYALIECRRCHGGILRISAGYDLFRERKRSIRNTDWGIDCVHEQKKTAPDVTSIKSGEAE